MNLSVCMIIKNEEKYIEQCLKAIKDFTEEIIIVDTGSTDNTSGIINKFIAKEDLGKKIKLFNFRWNDDFSAARNFSLEKAAGSWILVLDADELITKKDFERLRDILEKAETRTAGFTLHQRNYTMAPDMFGWQPIMDYKKEAKQFIGYHTSNLIRVFRNNQGIKFRHRIHESVTESIKKVGEIKDADIVIHHYARETESRMDEKLKKYLILGELEIKDNPGSPKPLYENALIYNRLGQTKKAVEYLVKVAKINAAYKNTLTLLGILLIKEKNLVEAVKAFKKSIEVNPTDTAYVYLGALLEKVNDTEGAIASFKEAIILNKGNIKAYQNICKVYIKQKMFDEAIDFIMSYLAEQKKNKFLINSLAEVYVNKGEKEKAIEVLEENISKDNTMININLMVNLANLYAQKGNRAKARDLMENALSLKPANLDFIKKKLEEFS